MRVGEKRVNRKTDCEALSGQDWKSAVEIQTSKEVVVNIYLNNKLAWSPD